MSRALADALVKLLAQADETPATRFTQAQRSALDALARATGLLSTRPQGRGIVYRIVNRAGRGLGLTFCKLAVEAHGGRIWIEDAAPGAVFCLTVPHAA